MSSARAARRLKQRVRIVYRASASRRCCSCGKPLPVHGKTGAPPKHCANERCARIHYSGHHRTKCTRCSEPLPIGRQHQRNAICGRCFVDLCDLMGLHSS